MDKRNKSGALDLTAWEALRNLQGRRRSKYGNTKVEYDGYKFDSKAEANRYRELKLLEKAGEIFDLVLQPKFTLVPKTVKRRAVTYSADFRYYESCDESCEVRECKDNCGLVKDVVEDVKSSATAKNKAYIVKRNLFEYQNPDIVFRETMA